MEEPLEEEMAMHSSILAWKIPWTEKPGGLQSRGSKESDTTEGLNECACTHTHTHTPVKILNIRKHKKHICFILI